MSSSSEDYTLSGIVKQAMKASRQSVSSAPPPMEPMQFPAYIDIQHLGNVDLPFSILPAQEGARDILLAEHDEFHSNSFEFSNFNLSENQTAIVPYDATNSYLEEPFSNLVQQNLGCGSTGDIVNQITCMQPFSDVNMSEPSTILDATDARTQSRIARRKRSVIHQQKRTQGLLLLSPRSGAAGQSCRGATRAGRQHRRAGVAHPPPVLLIAATEDHEYNNAGGSSGNDSIATTSNGAKVCMSEDELVYQLHKELSPSDVGSLGRIILPKIEAQKCLPLLGEGESKILEIEDFTGVCKWNLRFRYWPNNKSRMYLFENTGELVKYHGLKDGDKIILYKNRASGNYVIYVEKSSMSSKNAHASTSQEEVRKRNKRYSSVTLECKGENKEEHPLPTNNLKPSEDTSSMDAIQNFVDDNMLLDVPNKNDEEHQLFVGDEHGLPFYEDNEIFLTQDLAHEEPNDPNVDEELDDLFVFDK
ncbi:hypothetical protein O6H91_12G028900 [Diphasiastrum complanatum]|uniref:Uncharacterized protein n=1 Tax=Diphasiastrum complanatum TaxID=34168 RepID=A0ACC2BZY8_DIPCM|nr:hypothetical protein O6H91_12G028900 [Diphasiastrum complanatum]